MQWRVVMKNRNSNLNYLKQLLNKYLDKSLDVPKLRILTEAYLDDEFLKKSLTFYKKLNRCNYDNLSKLFKDVFNTSKTFLEKSRNENLELAFVYFNKAHAYFSILESVIEDSAIIVNVLNKIKRDHDNYLKRIQELDKKYLSLEHNNKNANSKFVETNLDLNIQDELSDDLKLYLLFKNWQDITHYYYLENFKERNLELNKTYLKTEDEHFSINYKAISKRIIESFQNKVHLGEFLDAFFCGFKEEITQYIGGKGYGLLYLLSLDVNIPDTYVVSSTQDINNIIQQIPNTHKKYAVRSSANIEDGNNNSFAGLFDSFLNVKYENLKDYIQKVRNSIENNRAKEYISHNELQHPSMNVIVQRFIDPDFSGVWLGSKRNSGILEWVKGTGEKLVLGKVTPNTERFHSKTENVNSVMVGNSSVAKTLNSIQNNILKKEKMLCDFEWCVKDEQLYLLQFRPVTKIIQSSYQFLNNDKEENVIYGIPASPGKKNGMIKLIKFYDENAKINSEEILLTFFTDPEWLPLMKQTNCIITAVGGFLSHTAIIARELGITCVTGIGRDNFKKLANCKAVEVDGNKGTIKII